MRSGRRTSRIEVPDGEGSMKEVEADSVHEGKTFEGQEERLMEHSEEAAWTRIGKAAHAFNEFHKAYATDHGLTHEELVAAIYLENLNMKFFYPEEQGGPERYDEQCKKVYVWFMDNKDKP